MDLLRSVIKQTHRGQIVGNIISKSSIYALFKRTTNSISLCYQQVCSAREGVLLQIYEAQKKIVDFLEPNAVEEQASGWGDRGSGGVVGRSMGGGKRHTSTYFAEFVQMIREQEAKKKGDKKVRYRQNSLPDILAPHKKGSQGPF